MKILFWDIEATSLDASWGKLLAASFVDLDGNVTTFRIDKRPAKGKDISDDSKLAVKIRDTIEAADLTAGWNTILFDRVFVNARLAQVGERPIKGRELDLMYYSRGASMRIGSSRLEAVSKFFGTENNKTPLVGKDWIAAAAGDRKSLDRIVEHNIADVLVLRDLWPHLAPYVSKYVLPLKHWWRVIDQVEPW